MATLSNTFGIAMRNFQRFPELPDANALVDYGVRMEELGYDSLWVWDHILLGVDPHFPIIDSLSLLTAVAARTKTIKLGTGILVLPLRNPLVLAKQLSSMDLLSNGRLIIGMASGWYKREFDAVGDRGLAVRRHLVDSCVDHGLVHRPWHAQRRLICEGHHRKARHALAEEVIVH